MLGRAREDIELRRRVYFEWQRDEFCISSLVQAFSDRRDEIGTSRHEVATT